MNIGKMMKDLQKMQSKLMSDMEVPGGGSLKSLARNMEVVNAETSSGGNAEFLVFEVGSE